MNCRGQLLSLERPIVMGILNRTPDSFFAGSRVSDETLLLNQTEKMLREGAAILDIGGVSTRPGAVDVSLEEELARTIPAIEQISKHFPEAILSIDTFRAAVAEAAIQAGASVVNDISAGRFDVEMFATVAQLRVPYCLMHMAGTPQTMQFAPNYTDVTTEILDFFIDKIAQLRALGVTDIVLDPGFGFGKTVEHNFQLLKNLHVFQLLSLPVLAGISRKSMICKPLKIKPEHALNGTTALHMVALQQGAKILRAHDVREAMEVIRLWEMLG